MNSPYFSFTREPFSRELSPTEVFVSKGHQELLARLKHAIETGSLAVLTGQVGSGKSTAIRSVMHSLDASRYRYIYLASSELRPAEFYKNLLYQVNVQPGRGVCENKRLVTQAMLELHQKGIKPVVVIDEAQELTVPMLSELRFVLNYQTDSFSISFPKAFRAASTTYAGMLLWRPLWLIARQLTQMRCKKVWKTMN